MISDDQKDALTQVADQTLHVFELIATEAQSRLTQSLRRPADAFASVNSLTMGRELRTVGRVDHSEREASEHLIREPAIARVVAEDETGNQVTIFFTRAAAVSASGHEARFASYRSPMGRLAAHEPGDSVIIATPNGPQTFDIIERAELRPHRSAEGWDGLNTVFLTEDFGPVTIESLRRLLEQQPSNVDTADYLGQLLRSDEAAANIRQGRRRSIISRIVLRDQPTLDRIQDEIFRLPLNSRIALLGPPGTGKTTTLIRRLGQKLDLEHLDSTELAFITRHGQSGRDGHARSWSMFTPTDLLRHYVKEAFVREDVAASDHQVHTWTTYRRDIARNTLPILRSGSGGGPFVLPANEAATLTSDALAAAILWYEDFQQWQQERFWSDLAAAAAALAGADVPQIARLGATLSRAVKSGQEAKNLASLLPLLDLGTDIREALAQIREQSEAQLRLALNRQLANNRQFLDQLAAVIGQMADGTEDEAEDDGDAEEEAEETAPLGSVHATMTAYFRALRTQARNAVSGRRSRGRAAALLNWVGDRGLAEKEQRGLGQNLEIQGGLRRFSAPLGEYLNGMPRRYAAFRRARRIDKHWYVTPAPAGNTVHPLEVDVMLLAILRGARELLSNRRVEQELTTPAFLALNAVRGLQRNQILVDEVTDFSPVQLGCMAALADLATDSVFVCGDFKQRITNWGLRSDAELRWGVPGVELRDVSISYRQSRQLLEFGRRIAMLGGGEMPDSGLPQNTDSEGVNPALAIGLVDDDATAAWLAQRIIEIEAAVRPHALPSVAVLVLDEAIVDSLAEELNFVLETHNLRAVPCKNGQMLGQDNDVRVFDVQHIKGLEFEAVFFVGVDRLAARDPGLFDKYLYVGATRAATYLGMTCVEDLPDGLQAMTPLFTQDWR